MTKHKKEERKNKGSKYIGTDLDLFSTLTFALSQSEQEILIKLGRFLENKENRVQDIDLIDKLFKKYNRNVEILKKDYAPRKLSQRQINTRKEKMLIARSLNKIWDRMKETRRTIESVKRISIKGRLPQETDDFEKNWLILARSIQKTNKFIARAFKRGTRFSPMSMNIIAKEIKQTKRLFKVFDKKFPTETLNKGQNRRRIRLESSYEATLLLWDTIKLESEKIIENI